MFRFFVHRSSPVFAGIDLDAIRRPDNWIAVDDVGRPPTAGISATHRFFKAPVRFGARQTAIIFAVRWLKQPVRGAQRRTYGRLRRKIAAGLPLSASAQAYRAVRILMENGRVSGDRVAAMLEVNRRALSRQLQDEGETLQSIIDDVEFSLAHQPLSCSDTDILDIALKLGYSDASAFTRAFRRWTGTTPGKWRLAAQQRAEPSPGI